MSLLSMRRPRRRSPTANFLQKEAPRLTPRLRRPSTALLIDISSRQIHGRTHISNGER
jgi:hypothetical protein